ncbi:hypothetical protein BKA64DRAFT_775076, partial [Cadophora sp. MPI-SDFR-AT-0126]
IYVNLPLLTKFSLHTKATIHILSQSPSSISKKIAITMQLPTLPSLPLTFILLTAHSLAQDWQSAVNSAESLAPSLISSVQNLASNAVSSATQDASSIVASAQSVAATATAGAEERSSALSVTSAAVESAESVAAQATRSVEQSASSASAQATGTSGSGGKVDMRAVGGVNFVVGVVVVVVVVGGAGVL